MSTNYFFGRFCHFRFFHLAVVTLATLAWSSLAFGGEIHDAAAAGDLEKIRALLKDNPDLVNSKDTNSDDAALTPLGWAACFGHKDVAELLLAHGAEINATNYTGETPLHEAALHDQTNLAELLLINKADVNVRDNDGDTPLHFAVENRKKDVADLLRQHGGQE